MTRKQQEERYPLRLPTGWRDAIKVEAARNRRSMNSEIVDAICRSMEAKGVHLEAAST